MSTRSERLLHFWALAPALLIAGMTSLSTARADGTEALGPPSITIAEGTRIVVAGVGLADSQPGMVSFDVESDEQINQVLLYWSGFMSTFAVGDATIMVDGTEVTGTQIGGVTAFFPSGNTSTFRADITSLVDPGPGTKTLMLGGLSFDSVNHGAGVLAILDDGSMPKPTITIRDGSDAAFINFAPPLDTTVPQTFTFAAADVARFANLNLFAGSAVGDDHPTPRPTITRVTSGGMVTEYPNLLNSFDGEEWDTVRLFPMVPAGASSLTVQILSADAHDSGNLPASFVWLAAGLSLEPAQAAGCTPGYWKNHAGARPNQANTWPPTGFATTDIFSDVFGAGQSITLLQALQVPGGGVFRLHRHGTAALLNAAHPDVGYPLSVGDVITLVASALISGNAMEISSAGDALEELNELGCDLGRG